MTKVLIIQAQMKQYRVPLFLKLQEALKDEGIELRVAYSPPAPSESKKRDNTDLPESIAVRVPGYWGFRDRVFYQPLLGQIADADLTIVEYANKYILNHFLLLLQFLHVKRIAFWGLGANKQSDRSSLSEWYKRITARHATWYFAYTRGVADELITYGVPAERITAVQNAVDTRELQDQVASIANSELQWKRKELGIRAGDRVALFCGMLHPVKSIPFLVDCAKLIKRQIPTFHLLLVGGGSDYDHVRSLTANMPWIHLLGPKFGKDKAIAFKLADACLLPGRVGLVILDCFATGLPLFTVRTPIHGPEVEYLEEGVNGFMVQQDADVYAATVARVLGNEILLRALRQGAMASAAKYSIEVMVENFKAGIVACLRSPTTEGVA